MNAASDRLIAPAVEAEARPHTWCGVAFGRRVLLLLGAGLFWSLPAFFDLRLIWAMLAWDALVLLAWAIDLAQVFRARPLVVERRWIAPAALSVESFVTLVLRNGSATLVHVGIVDAVPSMLRGAPPLVTMTVRPRGQASASYSIRPTARGDVPIGDAFLRCQGPLRLAERWLRAALPQMVRVYPNLEEAKRQSVYLVRSRQIALEKRHMRVRGAGREFESLREYREGDEFRDICWTAAARRGKLVTRTYQVERSQTVWLVIDTGRLMRARVGHLTKLDYAVNAALGLSQVALASGDRVGLLAYGREIRNRIPAARGSAHLRNLMAELATVREETGEADHLQAAGRLLSDQKRRSLIVWLTDLAETAMTPEVIDAASGMMPRHLVLFVVIGQPDMRELAARNPENETAMFQAAAAQEVLQRRDLLLARLRDRGLLALEADSATLSPTLVNSYLSVKARNQL
ncbi:MAG TPA: DUF58 domain-containing protein [Vicinamibacterales bacterium]